MTMENRSHLIKLNQMPLAFHLLAKPAGAVCNLRCKYCFFLEKEKLYPGSTFRMTDSLLETYIQQLIEAHRTREIMVAWQGGEPMLMGLDFFKRSLELEKKYARPGTTILNSIQTNGTLINDEWAEFFKANDFLVGISIDGPQALHDCYRVDRGGLPTFERVMRGLSFLKKHNIDWNVLTTINHANARHGIDVYHFLKDECQSRFMQFIPVVEKENKAGRPVTVTDRSVGALEFGQFLIDIFDEWVRHDVSRIYVQTFDVALASWYGTPPAACTFAERCGTALALEHNGDLYSCDHFVEPQYKLGNILTKHMAELVASDQQFKFGQDKYDTLPAYCRNCDVCFACHGACPKDRFLTTPAGEPGLNYLCEGYKMFFRHIDKPMRLLSELLKQNRHPSEIMKHDPWSAKSCPGQECV